MSHTNKVFCSCGGQVLSRKNSNTWIPFSYDVQLILPKEVAVPMCNKCDKVFVFPYSKKKEDKKLKKLMIKHLKFVILAENPPRSTDVLPFLFVMMWGYFLGVLFGG